MGCCLQSSAQNYKDAVLGNSIYWIEHPEGWPCWSEKRWEGGGEPGRRGRHWHAWRMPPFEYYMNQNGDTGSFTQKQVEQPTEEVLKGLSVLLRTASWRLWIIIMERIHSQLPCSECSPKLSLSLTTCHRVISFCKQLATQANSLKTTSFKYLC